MPEYLAPGVYIQEIETGPRPIEGVSTSTTGFVGQTERGPTAPRLLTSWDEFIRWYGSYVDRVNDPNTAITPNRFLPYAVRGFFDNGGQRLFVARVTGPNAQTASGTLPGAPNNSTVTAVGPGAWGNKILLRVQDAGLNRPNTSTANWFRLTIAYYRDGVPNPFVDPSKPQSPQPDTLEDFDNLSIIPTDLNYAQTVVNGASRLIRFTQQGRPTNVDFPNVQLQNGTDVDATMVEYLDADDTKPIDQRTGLAGLNAIKGISIIGIPDEVVLAADVTGPLISGCELLKDRFAVTSVKTVDQEQTPVATLRPPQDSTYGAYYYPWIRVSAPHTAQGNILVPPTGHVAGIYARVDVNRGVFKAPANEVVQGMITTDLSVNDKPLRFLVDKGTQDILNPKGVNVIRDFRADGRDIRVWGARTMSSDPLWKYINVRRLFIFLEQSIDRGTQWVVFEPNYESTWAAVRLSITGFLRTVWRNGGLAGTTEDEAFFVKCDRTTMTQDDFDNGRLICVIGVAPVKPAEFVIFQIFQKTLDSNQ